MLFALAAILAQTTFSVEEEQQEMRPNYMVRMSTEPAIFKGAAAYAKQ